jgi:hypothetical protein
VGETLPWPRVPAADRLIVAFVRMAGEARPWGIAAGPPGALPTILTIAEPRDAGELSRLALAFGRILLPHLPHPEHATEAEAAELAALAGRRQLWMPGPTHVEMLHLLDYRFSRADAREAADARELGRLGRAAGWLFRESCRPGQVRVFDATARLREAFAVPAEDVRQQHLGFLLSWIGTDGPREARALAAQHAEQESVGVTMAPEIDERELAPLVSRWNASRADPVESARVAAQIQAVLAPELIRRFRLTELALTLLEGGGRPPNPEMEPVLELAAEEMTFQYWHREQKAAAPPTDPEAPRFFGDHPETDFLPTHAAARFFAHAHAAEVTEAALVHGDRHLVEEALERGNALAGTIVHVANLGTKRAVIPAWKVVSRAEGPLRLREESAVCVLGLRGRTGKVRSIVTEGGQRTVIVEIDGWKRARPGVPAADAAELTGTRVILVEASPVGISKRKSMKVWDASGPGAWLTHASPPPEPSQHPPLEDDLLNLVRTLRGP